ncbi:MAG: glycerol-3-phosphate dehydrogenase/oxidase [Candidatus Acidiferrales bacterium]
MQSRSDALRAIAGNAFDVCVIGGGATGAGCALDAQLRGLKTVLLEARDFGSATSSVSTKMVHGGVRYLEQAIRGLDLAEYGVVKRALRERIRMLQNAPFLTRTMELATPCFSRFECAYLRLGLKLYDWIAGRASLGASHFIPREETLRRLPTLNPDRLAGAMVYSDGQFDDARYDIALVATFTEAGGDALNYARVVGFEKTLGGKLCAAEVEDQQTHRRFMVRARAFVNATGPYADGVRKIAAPNALPRMRLSKGVHIVLPLEVLSSDDAMLIPKTEDGRVLFAIPWQGRLLVGTTEEEVATADDLSLMKEEAEYLLRHLNRFLLHPVAFGQVVSGTAGARPLVNSSSPKAVKRLARDHEVELDPGSGLISILGGKWTTYRAMAEDTIDSVQKVLKNPAKACRTKCYPLLGSIDYTPEYWRNLVNQFRISENAARYLARKYGTRASDVMNLATNDRELALPLVEGLAPLRAQVVFGIRNEMAISIEDILARRIGLELYGWKETIEAAPVVAKLLARELGWPETVRREAVDEYTNKIRSRMQKAGLAPVPAGT